MSTIEERVSSYPDIKQQALRRYSSFEPTPCRAFDGERVFFTAEGFNHLVYPSPKKERDRRAQILRFDMLERAKLLIGLTTTYQEYDEEIAYRKVNRKGAYVERALVERMWGFVAIIRGFRIKVVIVQRGNGKKEFLSVAPAWYTKQYRDIKAHTAFNRQGPEARG
jgi:hypothetical protein